MKNVLTNGIYFNKELQVNVPNAKLIINVRIRLQYFFLIIGITMAPFHDHTIDLNLKIIKEDDWKI